MNAHSEDQEDVLGDVPHSIDSIIIGKQGEQNAASFEGLPKRQREELLQEAKPRFTHKSHRGCIPFFLDSIRSQP